MKNVINNEISINHNFTSTFFFLYPNSLQLSSNKAHVTHPKIIELFSHFHVFFHIFSLVTKSQEYREVSDVIQPLRYPKSLISDQKWEKICLRIGNLWVFSTYAAIDLDNGHRSIDAWYFMFSICFLSASRSIFAKILNLQTVNLCYFW